MEVHVRAKCREAKCSGSWVINSALDFGQLKTSIAIISGTDQTIDKRKTALATTIFPHWWNFGLLTKKMTLTFDLRPWNPLGFERLLRYMSLQHFIKLSAAIHELSLAQGKKLQRIQYSPDSKRCIYCIVSFQPVMIIYVSVNNLSRWDYAIHTLRIVILKKSCRIRADGLSVGLHYFDLLWICRTACCTTSCSTNQQGIESQQRVHNKL